jgi:hypothetical protein
MTNLYQGAEDYLELRRSLGFKLKRPCRFVREFVRWLQDRMKRRLRRGSRWNGPRSHNICNGPNGQPG